MPENLEEVLASCEYMCDGNDWVLVAGDPPAGYFCPESPGGCFGVGEVMTMMPVPIETDPEPVPPLGESNLTAQSSEVSNSGTYQFQRATDTLFFVGGKAEKGFRFLAKIPLSELQDKFPAIAAEVELIKNAKSLVNFTVEIPALPIVN